MGGKGPFKTCRLPNLRALLGGGAGFFPVKLSFVRLCAAASVKIAPVQQTDLRVKLLSDVDLVLADRSPHMLFLNPEALGMVESVLDMQSRQTFDLPLQIADHLFAFPFHECPPLADAGIRCGFRCFVSSFRLYHLFRGWNKL